MFKKIKAEQPCCCNALNPHLCSASWTGVENLNDSYCPVNSEGTHVSPIIHPCDDPICQSTCHDKNFTQCALCVCSYSFSSCNPCANFDCMNGKCNPNASTANAYCACDPFWDCEGVTEEGTCVNTPCNIHFDPCSDRDCGNGTCKTTGPRRNDFECQCDICFTNLVDNKSLPCVEKGHPIGENGQTCGGWCREGENEITSVRRGECIPNNTDPRLFECQCNKPWSGKWCDQLPSTCVKDANIEFYLDGECSIKGDVCNQQGVCQDNGVCKCHDLFSGPHCDSNDMAVIVTLPIVFGVISLITLFGWKYHKDKKDNKNQNTFH